MHRSLIAVTLLLLAPLANAQVYKWTDAGGTVHYSQSPPAEGTKFNKVKTNGSVEPLVAPAPAPAANAAQATTAPAAPAAPIADTPENRHTLCESLKSNIAALQGSAPVVMQQGDKSTALDDSQRKEQTGSAQAQYQQYCQSQ
ncbi:DUF4124 domain-containing protein [Rhodanobacter sp. MP7CTX1]|uniref:DUF4124 domain-containing protein n=1 Tax=Rhodanobacter sp. MP7CTX1 TaxID=2723084 RepID=UPI0017BE80D1|nr:DUF4124 domain-containing protein [Rhodanobacter sp. MP7CTX1]MBB6187343.1 hypothetical protein [Rhodanobacter sp. MP7CTX1]